MLVNHSALFWKWATEQRASAYRQDPDGALQCFAELNSSLPHVVVSDTSEVSARAAAHGMLTTVHVGDRPVHLGIDHTPDARNVERLFVDFWLLVSAVEAYTFSPSKEALISVARLRAGRPARYLNAQLCALQGQ